MVLFTYSCLWYHHDWMEIIRWLFRMNYNFAEVQMKNVDALLKLFYFIICTNNVTLMLATFCVFFKFFKVGPISQCSIESKISNAKWENKIFVTCKKAELNIFFPHSL